MSKPLSQGENGQNSNSKFTLDVNVAIKEFEKKFKEKTKNDWKNRENFEPQSGKYTLIEMDTSGDAGETVVEETSTGVRFLCLNKHF